MILSSATTNGTRLSGRNVAASLAGEPIEEYAEIVGLVSDEEVLTVEKPRARVAAVGVRPNLIDAQAAQRSERLRLIELRARDGLAVDASTLRRYNVSMPGTAHKRATVYFDPELHRALRIKAAETENSISELVNEAVRLSLAEDLEDLAAFSERDDEPDLPFERVLEDLKRRGRI